MAEKKLLVNKGGRPRAQIDKEQLRKLCELQCTSEEIAAWFNVCSKTIDNLRKQEEFASIMANGNAKGRISLRRKQMQVAMKGNASMLIWLGKTILGQKEVISNEMTGPNGEPMAIAGLQVTVSPEARKRIEQDVAKRYGGLPISAD